MKDQHGNWVMNSSAECLEPRMEVQFYDKYDLLGQSNEDPKNNEKGEIFFIIHSFFLPSFLADFLSFSVLFILLYLFFHPFFFFFLILYGSCYGIWYRKDY